MERPGPYTGHGGGSFEQTFQIVIVVLVQTANGDLFPGTLQLAFYIAVIRKALKSFKFIYKPEGVLLDSDRAFEISYFVGTGQY